MSHLFDPSTLFALAVVAESAGIAIAVAVGLWSRNPARRKTALKMIRAIRRSGGSDEGE